MAYGSATACQSASTAVLGGPKASESEALMKSIMDQIMNIWQRVARVEDVATRLVGEAPTKELRPDSPPPNCFTVQLSGLYGNLEQIEARLRDAVQRLETFI